jgi:hypothetical protein
MERLVLAADSTMLEYYQRCRYLRGGHHCLNSHSKGMGSDH